MGDERDPRRRGLQAHWQQVLLQERVDQCRFTRGELPDEGHIEELFVQQVVQSHQTG